MERGGLDDEWIGDRWVGGRRRKLGRHALIWSRRSHPHIAHFKRTGVDPKCFTVKADWLESASIQVCMVKKEKGAEKDATGWLEHGAKKEKCKSVQDLWPSWTSSLWLSGPRSWIIILQETQPLFSLSPLCACLSSRVFVVFCLMVCLTFASCGFVACPLPGLHGDVRQKHNSRSGREWKWPR